MKRSTMILGLLLTVMAPISGHAQAVLSIDINERGTDPATNTMPGFDSFLIDAVGSATAIQTAPTVRTFGAITVTLSGSGATPGYDDRLRATPVDSGAFTDGLLLRDFVFSRDNAGNDGLDVSIAGLVPDQFYRATIWSFDTSSGGTRVSDWFGNGIPALENYTFDGRVLPADNATYRFSFTAAADSAGTLLIQGRRKTSVDTAGAASFGVFLNALQLEPTVPEPVITIPPVGGTAGLGERFTFSVVADGVVPLSYQWFKDLTEIVGATSSSLTVANLAEADSGEYSVRVGNSFGTAASSATLTVLPDPAPDVRQGLVSYWPMNAILEDPGALYPFSTPDAYSGNTMRLVSEGFFDQEPGVFGDAISFNTFYTDQYAIREAGFPINNNPAFSVALWVKGNPTNQDDRRFFCESSTNSNNPLFCLGTHQTGADGTVRVFIRNDSGTTLLARNSTRTALDDAWHHVVWTETGGAGKLYIDGLLDETDFNYARDTLTLDQTAFAAVVRTNVVALFAGALDEVAVWNRVLTFTEIQEIRTAGIPPPVGTIPPEIVVPPESQSVLTRAHVSFSFTAAGTSPLLAQWRKDGTNLVGRTSYTLNLNSVSLEDAGDYDVVVSNLGGSVTSQVATLTVTLRPPAPAELSIDFNHTNAVPDDSQPGFQSFTLPAYGAGPFVRLFGGVEVTLSGIGVNLESRRRTTPTNAVGFTEEKLFQDFVFARDTTNTTGMDVAVAYLEPNQKYAVTLWSFDSGSPNARSSDWWVNGIQVQTNYTFDGAILPTSDGQYRFGFETVADADGTILIQGRRAEVGGTFNVFVNALRVARSELRVTGINLVDFGDLRLTIQVIDPSATYRVEEKASLTDPDWSEVAGVSFTSPGGNILEATFSPPPSTRFYRVVQLP